MTEPEIDVQILDNIINVYIDSELALMAKGNITVRQSETKDYLTTTQAACLLGMKVATFRNLVVRGMVPQGVIKDGKTVYERVQIQAFKENLTRK